MNKQGFKRAAGMEKGECNGKTNSRIGRMLNELLEAAQR